MSFALYRAVTMAAAPLIRRYLSGRAARGREDPARIHERYGEASIARPDGQVIWIHGASVGEALSMLSLIERLVSENPTLNILMTTGTVTSAKLLAERAPAKVIHQYVPLDRIAWVRRFLDHWRPDAVLWVESEFWPNLLCCIGDRKIPAVLINARISARSFKQWRRARWVIRRLLGNFDLCLAQTEMDADRLRRLGATQVKCLGNLKFSALPLPADEAALGKLRKMIGDRPAWLAASTHPGEEAIIAAAHNILRNSHPEAIAIIVPRHPARGTDIAAELRRLGSIVGLASAGQQPTAGMEIYIADSMGELGLYFRLARAAFMGGSLVPHGGQNLLEAAHLECPVIHGPHMANFLAITEEMSAVDATVTVRDADQIAREIARLIDDDELRRQRVSAARAVASAKQGIVDDIVIELMSHLRPLPHAPQSHAPQPNAPQSNA
jgi:3-deoxy-D-manno-octulosonic-acid transferase